MTDGSLSPCSQVLLGHFLTGQVSSKSTRYLFQLDPVYKTEKSPHSSSLCLSLYPLSSILHRSTFPGRCSQRDGQVDLVGLTSDGNLESLLTCRSDWRPRTENTLSKWVLINHKNFTWSCRQPSVAKHRQKWTTRAKTRETERSERRRKRKKTGNSNNNKKWQQQ